MGIAAMPTYREAYPRFNVLEADAAGQRDRQICVFHDEHGREMGQLFIGDSDVDLFTVHYWFYRPPYLKPARGTQAFGRLATPSGIHRDRYVMRCPTCTEITTSVYFTDTWQCATCHKLLYRTQVVDRETRYWERLHELNGLHEQGRPAGTRHLKFQAQMEERKVLQKALRRLTPRVASAMHGYIVSEQWLKPSQVADLNFPDFCVQGDNIVPPPWFEGQ